MGNLFNGRVSLSNLKYVPRAKVGEDGFLEAGDILLNRTNSIDLVGKVGLFVGSTRVTFASYLFRLRAIEADAHSQWLAQVLNSPAYRQRLREIATPGVSQANINRDRLRDVSIRLPPLGEQRKIAAILSSVDDAIDATQAVIDQLQVVKKAMMAELLTRGLPGLHTRFKQTEIGDVPEAWHVVRAGELCSVITKGATPAEQTRDAGEVPFLKVYNLDRGGRIDFDYQPTFIPSSVHEHELRRSRVVAGDVLMNIVGPPLGKIAVVPRGFPESNINQAIAVFRPVSVEAEFLAACLAAPSLFAWAVSRAKRTSTQLNLTLEICRDYPMPLPPPEERSKIVAIFAGIDRRIDASMRSLDGLAEVKSALMSVLLTGELRVTPDPEPV
jgi:type I restriction enzyme S subunit